MASFATNTQIYRLALALYLFLNAGLLFAQQRPSRSVQRHYKKAEEALEARDFDKTIRELKIVLKKDKTYLPAHFKLLYVYKILLKKEDFIAQIQVMLTDVAPRDRHKLYAQQLLLAKELFRAGDYEKAQYYLSEYFSDVFKPTEEACQLQGHLSYAIEAQKRPTSASPTRLSGNINAFAAQYFPSLTLDQKQLLFTARRALLYESDENLYISQKNGTTGAWDAPVRLPDSVINSAGNEGAATLSANGRILIFTACHREDGIGNCDLYVSRKYNGTWQMAESLGSPINSAYWESQPSLSWDARTLYFASDRPGGKGKRDIWYSLQDSLQAWSEPKNIGAPINTLADEIAPFIHANDGSLYFSSNGHAGMGGFDLFLSQKRDEKHWKQPQNLGYPLNDFHDQVAIFVVPDGTIGYYTYENRSNMSHPTSDLYKVSLPVHARIKKHIKLLRGTVKDAETGAPLRATLCLRHKKDSQCSYQIQSQVDDGSYLLALTVSTAYALDVQAPGYALQPIFLDKIPAADTVLDVFMQPLPLILPPDLRKVYFVQDSDALDSRSTAVLQEIARLLHAHPRFLMEIAGHADDLGTNAYNQELSLRRAVAAYRFLQVLGIPTTRLSYVGYGEERPDISNQAQKGRKANRCVAFRILP